MGRRPRARTRARAALALAAVMLLGTTSSLAGVAAATSTPPPTPVPPHGSPSPFPTVLVTPRPSLRPPPVGSSSAILEDLRTGQVLYAKSADVSRPMASLTKVMTALVVLSKAKPSDEVVVPASAAAQSGSVLGLQVGERITVRELLYGLLLQSSNDAAVALAEHVGGTVPGFVAMMNRQSRRLGLSHSHFTDPSGLDNGGTSSARDLAAVARAAYEHPYFEQIVRTRFHDVPAPSGTPRHIQNRNVLLWLYPGAVGVKTGFTTPAGHCLIAAADRGGTRLVVVAMGATGPDDGGVFNDAAALLNYGFAAFEERALIEVGHPLGSLTVEGAEVPAVAAATLLRLVRRDRVGQISTTVIQDRGVRLPVTAGQPLGRVVVTIAGRRAGEVPAVAAATVTRPATSSPVDRPRPDTPLEQVWRALRFLIQTVLGPFL